MTPCKYLLNTEVHVDGSGHGNHHGGKERITHITASHSQNSIGLYEEELSGFQWHLNSIE